MNRYRRRKQQFHRRRVEPEREEASGWTPARIAGVVAIVLLALVIALFRSHLLHH